MAGGRTTMGPEAQRLAVVVLGTLVVHAWLGIFIVLAGDRSIEEASRRLQVKPRARVQVFDIEVEPPPPPPPPPPPSIVEPPPIVEPAPKLARTTPAPSRAEPRRTPPAEPPPPLPPPTGPTVPGSGGAPTVSLPDIAPAAHGVAVGSGTPTSRRVGQGGRGIGTGSGTGAGAGNAPPPPVPMSVATIKTRAKPKGDYGYLAAGKDYPAEARRLGIEGKVRVRLLVDATGKVTTRTLLNKLGHGLDELALAQAKALEFEPALDTSDQPVASVVIWTFDFTLPK